MQQAELHIDALRVVDDLFWRIRRAGFPISTTQAIAALRALDLVGLLPPTSLRRVLAAILVARAEDRRRLDAVVDGFFAVALPGGGLPAASPAPELTPAEREALDDALRADPVTDRAARLRDLLDRGSAFDRMLVLADRVPEARSERQIGFHTHRFIERIGLEQARAAAREVRARLERTIGARGGAIGDALERRLEGTRDEVRDHVIGVKRHRKEARGAVAKPFLTLSDEEVAEVTAVVHRLASTLRGGARVRARRARRGASIDAPATNRRAASTLGVPVELVRLRRPTRPRRLMVLCDVSQSVRGAARFFLELAYTAQDVFDGTRTFAFVSDVGEVTRSFREMTLPDAIEHAWNLRAASPGSNSNYGRVLRRFERSEGRHLDRRTSVVILGDGRSNFGDPAVDVLRRLRARVRDLVWLCPEPRQAWGDADSAMGLYAAECSAVHEVVCANDLLVAAGRLIG